VYSSQRFIRWGSESLVLQSPLSADEAVERLEANLETSVRFTSKCFFSGEVQGSTFTLAEAIHFGKRDTGIRIYGEIVAMPIGSEIVVHIRPLVPDVLSWLLLLVLGTTGLGYLSYLIFLGQYPMSALIFPLILFGVFGIVIYSSLSDPTPPYANIKAHLRELFMVTAPTKTLDYW